MSWKPKVLKFVDIELAPLNPADNLSKYKLVNKARNDAILGILTLTHEEQVFLTDRLITGTAEENSYRQWITVRLKNPHQFTVNGRNLATLTVQEQIDQLNAHWDAGKLLPSLDHKG